MAKGWLTLLIRDCHFDSKDKEVLEDGITELKMGVTPDRVAPSLIPPYLESIERRIGIEDPLQVVGDRSPGHYETREDGENKTNDTSDAQGTLLV